VLRSVQKSDEKFPALELPKFTIRRDPKLIDSIGTTNGLNWISTRGFNEKGGDFDGNAYCWIDKEPKEAVKIRKGDLVFYGGHIAIVHSERHGVSEKKGNYDIIHASGINCTAIKKDKTCSDGAFSRKVLVTKDTMPGLGDTKGFGRIKLWE
jgi:hypothetical protein